MPATRRSSSIRRATTRSMPTPITTTAASRRRACTAGGGFANSASGFGTNVGYATNGGSDTAYFFDSPGNDTFYAYADYATSGKPSAGMYGGLRRRICQLGQRFRHERRLCDQRRQRYGLLLRFAGQRHVLCLRRLRQQRQAVRPACTAAMAAGMPIRPAASPRTSAIRPTAAAIRPISTTRRGATRSTPMPITATTGRPSAGMFGGYRWRVCRIGQRLRHERRLCDRRRQRHGLFLRLAGQ